MTRTNREVYLIFLQFYQKLICKFMLHAAQVWEGQGFCGVHFEA
jgi:hypothetical protein